MNTKIGTSFGLALLMAVGVIATMLALGMFSTQKANADVNVGDINLSSTSAGGNGQLSIEFTHEAVLTAGSGQIVVTFDKNWGIPATIAKSFITLTTHQTTGGTSNPAVDPSIVAGANSTTITITIDDTDSSTTGNQSMQPQAGGVTTPHILVFSPLAGITNPTASGVIHGGTDSTASANWIAVHTTAETTPTDGAVPTTGSYTGTYADVDLAILRSLSLSPTSGPRGTEVTATGKGYSSTGTATVWIDDGDGSGTADDDAINGTELILASGVAVSGGTFTATFTADSNFDQGANTVNAIDGGGTADATGPAFTVSGKVSVSKTSASRGSTVKITLAQYGNGTISTIKFGGVEADLTTPSTGSITVASNAGSLTIVVPATTPLGTQVVAVASSGESTRSTTIEVTGAPVTISPATAVAGQTVTASGSGFTPSSNIASITVGGTSVAAAGLVSPTTFAGIATDNSGNAVVSFKIPITILTAGDYNVELTDAAGRTGADTLTVPARTMTLTPDTGKRGSTVELAGTGFAAANNITISYTLSGATSAAVSASATADSSGNWAGSVIVPTTANIPSTNTITGTAATAGGAKTVNHSVPGATVVIDPTAAQSGDTVILTGTDFPAFASVAQLDIGTIDARPSPAPSTDKDGNFSATVLVPGLTTGTQAVIVQIANITANTSLTVEAASAASAVTTPTTNATETVFADVTSDDNLVRVWRFSNADQSWAFYDPRPAFAAANTLTDTSSGDIVWVNVTTQQDFQSKTLFPGWNLISLN
jgi:hypothetical protein